MSVDAYAVLENPVVSAGFLTVTGMLSVDDAVRKVTDERFLAAFSDTQLHEVIEEAAAWALERHGDAAGYGTIWQRLCFECATAQLKRIGKARRLAPQQVSDARFSDWAGFAAWQTITYGYWAILFPDLRQAYALLGRAEAIARGLPDLNQPRFTQIAAALFGQVEVAAAAGHPEYAIVPQQRLDELLAAPGWLSRAEDQRKIRANLQHVWRLRDELATTRAHGPAEPPTADPVGPVAAYFSALTQSAADVIAGRTDEQTAVAHARQIGRVPLPDHLEGLVVGLVTAQGWQDVRHGVLLARLHLAATTTGVGDDPAPARALAEYTLGRGLVRWQLREPDSYDVDAFTEAAHLLSSCLPSLDAMKFLEDAAIAQRCLGMALRGQGRTDEAHHAYLAAVKRLESLADSKNRRVELPSAWGNLADTYELMGRPAEALDLLIRAQAGFVEAGDYVLALQALRNLWRLARSLGRGDEAATAAMAAVQMLESLADLRNAARSCVELAGMALRYGRIDVAYEVLGRAEAFLGGEGELQPGRDPGWYAILSDVLLLQGVLVFTITSAEESLDPEQLALIDTLAERSRAAADRAGREFARVNAMILAVRSAILSGDRTRAQHTLDELWANGVPDALQPDVETLMAKLLDEEPAAAVPHLRRAVDGFRDRLVGAIRREKLAATLVSLGDALEHCGQPDDALAAFEEAHEVVSTLRLALARDDSRIGLRASFESLYERSVLLSSRSDPSSAWMWMERAKGRAMVELMGLSPIALDPSLVPHRLVPLLVKESELLGRLRCARTSQFTTLTDDSLDDLNAAVDGSERLLQIWEELRHDLPDYVAIRTSQVLDWRAIQRCLAG